MSAIVFNCLPLSAPQESEDLGSLVFVTSSSEVMGCRLCREEMERSYTREGERSCLCGGKGGAVREERRGAVRETRGAVREEVCLSALCVEDRGAEACVTAL